MMDEEMGMMNSGHDHDESEQDFEIAPGEVVKKIQNKGDFVLLDVRTPAEHEEVRLENSKLLPVGELSANTLANIGLGENMKDAEIILYCRSGNRSKQAFNIMKSLGYTNIKSVAGGMVHWQEDKYPFTETGPYQGGEVINDVEVSGDIEGGAQISFNKTTHDFGDVPQSKGILQTTFEVINIGDADLKIGELSTSCGCTSAEISHGSVEPGGVATLTVYFDPDFHKEPSDKITRTVFIPTNDSNIPEAEVNITVDILEGE